MSEGDKGFGDSFRDWIIENNKLEVVENSFELLINMANGNIGDSKDATVQLKAIQILLDAIYGKPPQADFLSSSDGTKNVNVKFE